MSQQNSSISVERESKEKFVNGIDLKSRTEIKERTGWQKLLLTHLKSYLQDCCSLALLEVLWDWHQIVTPSSKSFSVRRFCQWAERTFEHNIRLQPILQDWPLTSGSSYLQHAGALQHLLDILVVLNSCNQRNQKQRKDLRKILNEKQMKLTFAVVSEVSPLESRQWCNLCLHCADIY